MCISFDSLLLNLSHEHITVNITDFPLFSVLLFHVNTKFFCFDKYLRIWGDFCIKMVFYFTVIFLCLTLIQYFQNEKKRSFLQEKIYENWCLFHFFFIFYWLELDIFIMHPKIQKKIKLLVAFVFVVRYMRKKKTKRNFMRICVSYV